MSYVLTLVAADPVLYPVKPEHIQETFEILNHYNIRQTCAPVWLAESRAVDLGISEKPASAYIDFIRSTLAENRFDVFVSLIENRRKKLLIADMDGTIIHGETLDELADCAGIKDQIAAITVRAMEGEIDFASALAERVRLLKNLDRNALEQTLARMTLNPGATQLIKVMKEHGALCVLVSGGFTFFTNQIAIKAGFHYHHGNSLVIENNKLTGRVHEPILDKNAKVEFMRLYMKQLKIRESQVLALGDGANDIPMLKTAGLGIGYHPKGAVIQALDNLIIYGDLTAALYAQGYTTQHLS